MGKYSRQQTAVFSSFFPQKIGFDSPYKLPSKEFRGGGRGVEQDKYSKFRLLNGLPSMLSVNTIISSY